MGLGRVKTPTCNLRVEIPTRFRQLENQKYLRPLLGEDDRENNSAHSWLVHVFTQPGSKSRRLGVSKCCQLWFAQQTWFDAIGKTKSASTTEPPNSKTAGHAGGNQPSILPDGQITSCFPKWLVQPLLQKYFV